jgi:hypothetical protein
LGRDNNDFITGWLLPSIKAQLVLVIKKKRAGVSLLFFMRRVGFNISPGLNFSRKPVVSLELVCPGYFPIKYHTPQSKTNFSYIILIYPNLLVVHHRLIYQARQGSKWNEFLPGIYT